MSAASSFSVLGADVAIVGDITAGAELHIDGRVEGDISCASLVQGEASEIRGAVKVESARLAGKVRGTISASELVILRTAQVDGDVEYDSLTIEPGAKVGGRIAQRDAMLLEPLMSADESAENVLILAASGN